MRIFQWKDRKDGETGKTAGKALERTFEKTKDMRRKTRKCLQCFKQKPPAFSPKTLNVFEEKTGGFCPTEEMNLKIQKNSKEIMKFALQKHD